MITKSKAFASTVLTALPTSIAYHSYSHTHLVAMAAEEISKACGLSDADLETVIIAAWFHDTGFKEGFENHEAVSARFADEELVRWGASAAMIANVKQAIAATKMPQHPVCLLDKILCDADLHYLSTADYGRQAALLRRELHEDRNRQFSDEEWKSYNIKFLKEHRYFSDYGKTVLEERKRANINE